MAAKFVRNFSAWDFDEAHDRDASGKITHYYGYDAAEKFLMLIPGDMMSFTTSGAVAGMSVSLQPSGICKFDEPPVVGTASDNIPIRALSEGTATLLLKAADGKPLDTLEIKVAKKRDVTVRFYNIIDLKNRQAVRDPNGDPKFATASLNSLIARINDIVYFQAGVKMLSSGTGALRDLKFNFDLGNAVDINKTNPYKSTDLDHAADFHIGFVWGIDGAHANGITRSDYSLALLDVSLPLEKREITLAHEFVHFLCGSGVLKMNDHDEQKNDLMYKSAPHGVMMRKSRLNKIIRT